MGRTNLTEIVERILSLQRTPPVWRTFLDATRVDPEMESHLLPPRDPVPVLFKEYPRLPAIPLPHPGREEMERLNRPFLSVVQERRSVRAYAVAPIPLTTLSALLRYSAGIRPGRYPDWQHTRRFYPSGGALYPLEVYMCAWRVEGLDPGVYHYNVRHHHLERLRPLSAEEAAAWTGRHFSQTSPWAEGAALTLVITAAPWRHTRKYGERGARHTFTEVGIVAQQISLVAAALGLGTCLLGGLYDDLLSQALDLERDEPPMLGCVVGVPDTPSEGNPPEQGQKPTPDKNGRVH